MRYGLLACFLMLVGCGPQGGPPPAFPPLEVTTATITPQDVPISLQYIGQTESSRLVEIRARVDGYLMKKFYAEGELVRQGEPLFQIDPRPLQVAAGSADAAVKDKESAVQNARQTLDRMKLLVAENAVSRKDVDDARAAEKSADAALAVSQAEQSRAAMNLSYARITSPVTGLAGRSTQAEGSYISPAASGSLTTVAQVDPIWVSFSISESEWLRFKEEAKQGTLRFPKNLDFDVELILSDGSLLPKRGKINFSAPSVDTQTGTYAVRASFANSDLAVSPGQFVRVRLNGATRPNAILVPQRAVLQGQTGKFVYVAANNKAEVRPVEVGDWHGDQWFINSGLKSGEQIVVGGIVKVQPGAPLKIVPETAKTPAPPTEPKK
ncbi:MAG: efflux RND transporter periplasmic adaptor subunit [Sulfuricella sp.]|nr:efflux RND transporter periplasmic adaptor subunit [Sulfuricella sp.]